MAPLLSICIPTYNRAEFLPSVIESIVKQQVFQNTSDVNIIICDNASTDNTEAVIKDYIHKYPDKIFYYRNEENIGFSNFERVMSFADGEFLKLNNDTLIHKENSLEAMLDVIRKNKDTKRQLFFLNNASNISGQEFVCSNLDEFLDKVSYYITWIASFGLWKSDFEKTGNLFLEQNPTQIPQTYLLCYLISKCKTEAVVNNQELFVSLPPRNKGGYNIAEVFGQNYLNILNEFTKVQGGLSKTTFETQKRLILDFINDFYFDLKKQFAFQKTGYFKYMFPHYKYNFYFYIKYFLILYKKFYSFVYNYKSDDKHRTIKLFGFIKISVERKKPSNNKEL